MTLTSFHRSCLTALALAGLVCLSSCAVPLAPGYSIEKQSISVHFVPGAPPHLAIRAEYRLANVGNSRLDSIEVGLPGRKGFGRENLRVQVQGREVTPVIVRGADADEGESSSSESWPVVWRIPFSPAWPRKQKRNLLITYDLTAATEPLGRMYVSPSMFYLNDSGWFPDPLAPKSFLARDLVRPDPSVLDVIVPQNFLALGSGEPRGVKKSSAEAEYHFRIRKDDFDPFVLAGQYHEQRVTTSAGTVVIWTFKPVPAADAQREASLVASAAKFYIQAFGPLPRSMKVVHDAELYHSDELINNTMTRDFAGLFLPGVTFSWLTGGVSADSTGSFRLASTWFNHVSRPQPEAWILADSLDVYASDLQADNASPASSRNGAIASFLQNYDTERSRVAEKPILSMLPNDSVDQVLVGREKLILFFYALEDKCGRDNLNHALAHMVSALRFQQYGYDDFRSALEQECHQDLGPLFRSWLNEKGIPADFRAKYEPASNRKN